MKIDLHVHTSEVSRCGKVSAAETVRLYKQAGYDAIVITNHFEAGTADYHAQQGRPDFFQVYSDGLKLAQEAGEKEGLLVLGGYELRFTCNINDYLVYGMPDELAKGYRDLFTLSPHAFSEIAKKYAFLFYQAHPFRDTMVITNPDYLFGIEVFNGAATHDSRNDIAELWAEKFHLHRIAGSDCHRAFMVGRSGIETDEPVKNMDDLVEVLKNDRYKILYPAE